MKLLKLFCLAIVLVSTVSPSYAGRYKGDGHIGTVGDSSNDNTTSKRLDYGPNSWLLSSVSFRVWPNGELDYLPKKYKLRLFDSQKECENKLLEFVHIGNARIVSVDGDLLLQSEMQAGPFILHDMSRCIRVKHYEK